MSANDASVAKVHKKFNLWRGIYNKDKNYILGRTPKNWGKKVDIYIITNTMTLRLIPTQNVNLNKIYLAIPRKTIDALMLQFILTSS